MSANKLLGDRVSLTADPVQELSTRVAQITAQRSLNDKSVAHLAISTESFNDSQRTQLVSTFNNLETTLKNTVGEMGISVEGYQLEAATIGGLMAADPGHTLAAKARTPVQGAVTLNLGLPDASMERISTEAYDERENRNAQMNSIVFNLLASRQDDFGELFFPTIIVSPNEVGITLAVKLFYVYNDFKRSATGALANYNRKNIIRAYADTSILKNELTRGVPVRRASGADANTDKFVDVALVPGWAEDLGTGVVVETAALKVDTKVDLIGISQTNELLASGLAGPTDALDSYVRLKDIFVKFTDGVDTDIVRIHVADLPPSTFTYAPQGNSRRMILTMDTDSVVLSAETTKVNGAPLEVLTELASHNARLSLNITGSAVLDKNEGVVNRGSLALTTLRTAAGGMLVSGATFNDMAAKVATAEVLGYSLEFYRANSNLRQRGQLVDTQTEYRVINVPWRSPLGVLSPVGRATAEDTTALQTLVNTAGMRVSNDAVRALLRAQQTMASYKNVADASGNLPEMTAIGHYYVNPVYMHEVVSLPGSIDSLKSHERIKDIRAALVEKLRYMANEMYRRSEYKAAATVLTGNATSKPTVIVGTDPVLHNYLIADGDLRTLGETFDVRLVSTLADEVKGKIFISFGVFDQGRNTSVNPLNFGNMLYTPEMVLNLPISRDGQTSNELTVSLRYGHFQNLPVMGVMTVTGLPESTGKITVNTKEMP